MHDSHAHLTIEPISSNLESTIERFKKVGGKHILNVSYDPQSCIEVVKQYHEQKGKFSNTIKIGLGLHPEYFSELSSEEFDIYDRSRKAISLLEECIENNKEILSAIGETGLDYFHIFQDSAIQPKQREEMIEAQKLSFRRHLEIALHKDIPLTIHTRDLKGESICTQETLKIVAQVGKGKLRGSFHSYTGELKYVKDILDLGFHIGINGIVTYPSASNVREIVQAIPSDRILIETDCPLLPPQSVRRNKKADIRYGQPSDVKEILEFAAQIKGIAVDKMEEVTDKNFEKLFLGN